MRDLSDIKKAPRAHRRRTRLALLLALTLFLGLLAGCSGGKPQESGAPQDAVETTEATKASEAAEPAEAADTTSDNGSNSAGIPALRVDGTRLVDNAGKPVRIKGVSTHGLAWFPQFVDRDGFRSLRDEWGVNCIRLALYTGESGGYCAGGDPAGLEQLIDNGVQYTTDLGMYCIIDWHILSDGDPTQHAAEAKAFFAKMAERYGDHTNVLYEICNEPNGGTSWATIKAYAEEVIPVIRQYDPDAVILVGTPNWSQDIDQAADDPITGQTNIMYTVHFYAGTHRDWLRNKLSYALGKGLPAFVSEFGISEASGNGAVDAAEGDRWIAFLDENGVSYVCWNLSNKDESCALIAAGCSKTSGWSDTDLSAEGQWYKSVGQR